MKRCQRRGAGIVGLIFLFALVVRLYVAVSSCVHIPVTSDESITVLQARQIMSGEFDLFVWAQPYQFPVEAYLMAPISKLLPGNAFGARCQSFLISFMSLFLMLLILRKMGGVKQSWPAIMLVLFPSAYLMMIQFGYPIPHYTSAFLFWWLAIMMAVNIPLGVTKKSMIMVFLVGFFCGLAFTNNMVSLAVVAPLAVVVCMGMGLSYLLRYASLFGAGLFLGLLPYLVGLWRYSDAQVAVAGTREAGVAIQTLWSPALSSTLPRAMGIAPGLFPDSNQTLAFGEGLMEGFAVIYCLILLYGTILCAISWYKQVANKTWPRFTVNEIFIGASWLGIAFFIFSKRADAYSYRYLTPAAWSFPFVVHCVYNGSPRLVRRLLGVLVIVLVCVNLLATFKLTAAWSHPDYAVESVAAPDLRPALEFMEQKGIKHCVASHWAAYRINFLSGGKVTCSQPHNERFTSWIVPYKAEVDTAENIAYVLTDDIRFLKPEIFERHMRTMAVKSKKQECGRFFVYYDFEREYGEDELLVSSHELTAVASNAGESAGLMVDGDMSTFWRTDKLQEKDMQVDISISEPYEIRRILLYCGMSFNDRPQKMRLETKTSTGWMVTGYATMNQPDKFRFESGHPVYGYPCVQTLMLIPITTDRIRIVIDEPSSRWAWTINEIEIFTKKR